MRLLPKLLIRADAGGVLGTGHVMRMIALAQAYMRRGGKVTIASVQCPDPIIERVEALGINHTLILEAELGDAKDSAATLDLCRSLGCKWLILDGYHFDEPYQLRVFRQGVKVLAVDDYGHCDTWHCDTVLNQNLGAEHWVDRKSDNPKIQWLLGSSFALIREEFLKSIRHAKEKPFPAKNILITLGGADPDNVTSLVLQALERANLDNLHLRVLVGGGNLHRPSLESQAASSTHHIELLTNISDMPSMYEWADAVISAGGSTCWEWLSYGLPGAVVTIADNQEPLIKEFLNRDLALCLGWFTDFNLDEWKTSLENCLLGREVFACFESRRHIIDANGAARVAALFADGLWCRPAELNDIKQYFDWANDPVVRANGFHSDQLVWTNHCAWFKKILKTPHAYLYIVSNVNNEKIGQVRLTPDPTGYLEIGFSLDALFRGRGVGLNMLSLALKQAVDHHPNILGFIARVKKENKPSAKIFLQLGFEQVDNDPELDCLVYLKK